MVWVLRLVGMGIDGPSRSVDVSEVGRPDSVIDIADLELRLVEVKQLLSRVQREIVMAQGDNRAMLQSACRSCGGRCHVKGWIFHKLATLFGE
jgi:hypothetical protein